MEGQQVMVLPWGEKVTFMCIVKVVKVKLTLKKVDWFLSRLHLSFPLRILTEMRKAWKS